MTAALLVTRAGPQSTVQDQGRLGYQRYGVSVAGAFDVGRLAAANALVGNPATTAAIEMTLQGDAYEVAADSCRIALAGDFVLTIDGAPADPWRSHTLTRGQKIAVGMARQGLRGYLAVAGGWALAPVLGSRATHRRNQLGGLTGGPLGPGDRLPLASPSAPDGLDYVLESTALPAAPARLRVVLGPQDDFFTADGIATFLSAEFRLGRDSDRMGCRLDGPEIAHAKGYNIVSDGIALGAIQVPGNGLPIILGPDRQTTGGYPKIACLIRPDLDMLAQLRPGAALRFAAVDRATATALHLAWRQQLADLPARRQPIGAAALGSERLLSLNLIDGAIDVRAPEWRQTSDQS